MDLQMPEMDRFKTIVRILKDGINDYMSKSVSPRALNDLLRKWLLAEDPLTT
jgi:CheY-like chemotaxis protein